MILLLMSATMPINLLHIPQKLFGKGCVPGDSKDLTQTNASRQTLYSIFPAEEID